MKQLSNVLTLLSLMAVVNACNKDNLSSDGIQREEDLRIEDYRETDNYNQKIPAKNDGIEIERDKFHISPNETLRKE